MAEAITPLELSPAPQANSNPVVSPGNVTQSPSTVKCPVKTPPAQLVDDPSLTSNPSTDSSSKNKSPGHQGVNVSGGNNPNLRVLECAQIPYSFDYEMIYEKFKSFGEIQRIKLILTHNESAFYCYLTFSNSMEASSAFYYLRENDETFCKKCKISNVNNLDDDVFDFVPPTFVPLEERVERILPIPTWHVAFYKDGRENLIRGAETIQKKVGNIPRGNLKRYGKSLLIKAGNTTQAALLNNFKPAPDGNIKFISPHRSFNTLKGVIYSRDLFDFTEREILEKCPPSVYRVEKLKNNNAILLTFCSDYIPDKIFVEHSHIKVKKFHRRPTQCFNCYEYGHVFNKCKNVPKCPKCSGEHTDIENCLLDNFCFLCEGNHSPKSRNCPRFKFEQEVLEVANNQFISIGSAKQILLGANKNPDSTYASVVKTLKIKSFRPRQRESPVAGTKESPAAGTKESPVERTKESTVVRTNEPPAAGTNEPPAAGTKESSATRTKKSPATVAKERNLSIPQNHPGGTKQNIRKSWVPNVKPIPTKLVNVNPNSDREKEKKAKYAPKTEGTSKKSSRDDSDPVENIVPSKKIKGSSSSENVSEMLDISVSNSFAALDSLEGQTDKIVSAPRPQRSRSRSVENIRASSHRHETIALNESEASPPPLQGNSLPSGTKVKRLNFNNIQSQSPSRANAAGKQAKS